MKSLITISLVAVSIFSYAQKRNQTENVFIITLDGLRWQELFNGADSLLIDDSGYVEHPEKLTEQFWTTDAIQRRKLLMPFVWSVMAEEGQIYGNRKYGSKVNCTNQMWFSYPGYSEILCGFSDDENITSNSKVPNANTTVLEFLNGQKKLKGKVAAFGSWDVFPYIINEERSGVPVNAGYEAVSGSDLTSNEMLLNKLQNEVRSPWGSVRLDAFTHHIAMEYIKKEEPKVVYISYGETDDFAHDGEYDQYLYSAHQTDAYIKALWEYVQSTPAYKDKTTLLLTTDHGRGTVPKDTWRSHGTRIQDTDQIWMMAIGPDTKALGEVKAEGQLYQNQLAKTAAKLLGYEYESNKPVGSVIISIIE